MKELDRVIGYDSIKKELICIIDVLKNFERYEALGVTRPHGVLLDGVPGIGKSLLAKCFIEATGRKSYIIRKDKPDGEFVNHIRQTFEEAAENEPSVILLDDMDKFANSDNMHRDTEEYVTIQACIDEVKNKDVFVIATTNDSRKLPESLIRSGRFDKTFLMRFPTNEDAKKIIAFYLKDKNVADDIDTEEIARFAEGRSCVDLETVINEAGILAGFEGNAKITQENILKAILRKFFGFAEDDEISDTEFRRRAIHEAGHAVAIEMLYPGRVSFATVSSSNKSRVGGMVKQKSDSSEDHSVSEYEKGIIIRLAGRAAVEIVLQEVDVGAGSDLHKAFDSAEALVDVHCRYGFETRCRLETTDSTYYKHNIMLATEIARYYEQTKKLLNDNRAFLEAVIAELIARKTLSYKDIAVLREAS